MVKSMIDNLQTFRDSYIINVMACSVDGKIASHEAESTQERNLLGYTCAKDFERLRRAVAQCDVVFLGARSMACEKGAFYVSDLRKNQQEEPEWILFTRSGNVSFQNDFWYQKKIRKSIFFNTSNSDSDDETPFLEVQHKQEVFGNITYYIGNLKGLLNHLKIKKSNKIALLGGGKLNALFWEKNLVSELLLTISPIMCGFTEAPALVYAPKLLTKKLQCKKVEQSDDFVFIDYVVC